MFYAHTQTKAHSNVNTKTAAWKEFGLWVILFLTLFSHVISTIMVSHFNQLSSGTEGVAGRQQGPPGILSVMWEEFPAP